MVSLVAAHAQGGRCTSTDLGGKNACKGRCGDVFRREPFTFFNIYRRSLRRQRFGKALTFTFSDIRNFHRRSASLHVTINGQKKKKKSVGILRIGNRVASDVHNRFETLRTNGDGVEMTPLACSGWKTCR